MPASFHSLLPMKCSKSLFKGAWASTLRTNTRVRPPNAAASNGVRSTFIEEQPAIAKDTNASAAKRDLVFIYALSLLDRNNRSHRFRKQVDARGETVLEDLGIFVRVSNENTSLSDP